MARVREVFDVNLFGAMDITAQLTACHAARRLWADVSARLLPLLRLDQGRIVNIGSLAGWQVPWVRTVCIVFGRAVVCRTCGYQLQERVQCHQVRAGGLERQPPQRTG